MIKELSVYPNSEEVSFLKVSKSLLCGLYHYLMIIQYCCIFGNILIFNAISTQRLLLVTTLPACGPTTTPSAPLSYGASKLWIVLDLHLNRLENKILF